MSAAPDNRSELRKMADRAGHHPTAQHQPGEVISAMLSEWLKALGAAQ